MQLTVTAEWKQDEVNDGYHDLSIAGYAAQVANKGDFFSWYVDYQHEYVNNGAATTLKEAKAWAEGAIRGHIDGV